MYYILLKIQFAYSINLIHIQTSSFVLSVHTGRKLYGTHHLKGSALGRRQKLGLSGPESWQFGKICFTRYSNILEF